MRLRALLETDALGLRLLGGEDELDRSVRGVMTTDLRDPSRYLTGGELVLTGLAWRRDAADSEPFVRILTGAGVAGLAAGEAELGEIPGDLIEACERHHLPLFAVHETVAFATITEYVVRQVSGERAGDLAAVVDRHRRLMTSGPAGGGPEVVLDLLGSDLDLHAWVLSPTGRQIAGAGAPLPGPVGPTLAGHHLAATRTGRRGPHRATVDGVTYSLFPIRNTGRGAAPASRDVRESVLSDWLLAVEADAGDWPAARLDLLQGVTQLIAVERDRRDAARTVRRRLAQEVLELVQTGAAPAEIAARLRVAAPVLLPGLGTAPHWQVVVARVDWGAEGAPGATGGPVTSGIAGGPVAQALLEEILVDPAVTGPDSADRIAVAHTGDEAIALVPLPARAASPADTTDLAEAGDAGGAATAKDDPALHADALLAAVREPLSAGLADDGRLTLGVSAAVHSPRGSAAPWRRPGTRAGWRRPVRAGSARPATMSWPRTSCCCRSSPTMCVVRSPHGCSTRCATTTGATAPNSSRRWKRSWTATVHGPAARPGCTCTSTHCATGSGESSS